MAAKPDPKSFLGNGVVGCCGLGMSEAAMIEHVEARSWPPPPPSRDRLVAANAHQIQPIDDASPPGRHTTPDEPRAAHVLVLGLGNEILTDDSVGLRIVRALREQLRPAERIDAIETEEMGLSLLDHIAGYTQLLIVDAIQTGTVPPGHIHEFDGQTLPSRRTGAPHFLGVGDTLALGRLLGLPMPDHVTIVAVEVADPFTLGTELTTEVSAAVPMAVARALGILRQWATLDVAVGERRSSATPN